MLKSIAPYKTPYNYQNSDYKTNAGNNVKNLSKNSNILSISFTGQHHDPKQILLFSPETASYMKAGGMGDINKEQPAAYNKEFKDSEVRVMTVAYNIDDPEGMEKKKKGDTVKLNLAANKNHKTKLETKYTGLKTEFEYGPKTAKAYLLKNESPDKRGTEYYIYSPDISLQKKGNAPYQEDGKSYFEMMAANGAFNAAALKLTKQIAEDSEENFNPGVFQTTDWFTAKMLHDKNELAKDDSFYKGIRGVETLHNVGSAYQGRMSPTMAMLTHFTDKEIKKVFEDTDIEKDMKGFLYNKGTPVNINGKTIAPENLDEDKMEKDKGYRNAVLNKIIDHYKKTPDNVENYNEIKIADNKIRESLNTKPFFWDKDGAFNNTKIGLEACDKWFTVSGTEENTKKGTKLSGFLKDILTSKIAEPLDGFIQSKKIASKATAATNGMSKGDYNDRFSFDSRNLSLYQPFTIDGKDPDTGLTTIGDKKLMNFIDGKKANKLHLQDVYSDPKKAEAYANEVENQKVKVVGSLTKNPDAPLILCFSRYDENQKGIDYFLKASKKILDKYPESQIFVGGPDFNFDDKTGHKALVDFKKDIVENPDYKGRVVIRDGFVHAPTTLAGSDIYIAASNFEPCGLIHLQGMPLGAVPVVSATGGLDHTVTSEAETADKKLITGIKTDKGLREYGDDKNAAVNDLANAIDKAVLTYYDDKPKWNTLVQNCMEKEIDWNSKDPVTGESTLDRYREDIYGIPKDENMANVLDINNKKPKKANKLNYTL